MRNKIKNKETANLGFKLLIGYLSTIEELSSVSLEAVKILKSRAKYDYLDLEYLVDDLEEAAGLLSKVGNDLNDKLEDN